MNTNFSKSFENSLRSCMLVVTISIQASNENTNSATGDSNFSLKSIKISIFTRNVHRFLIKSRIFLKMPIITFHVSQ